MGTDATALAAALLLALSVATGATAQEPPAAPPAAAEEGPPPITAIDADQVAAESDRAHRTLRAVERTLAPSSSVAAIEKGLGKLREEIDDQHAQSVDWTSREASLSSLSVLSHQVLLPKSPVAWRRVCHAVAGALAGGVPRPSRLRTGAA